MMKIVRIRNYVLGSVLLLLMVNYIGIKDARIQLERSKGESLLLGIIADCQYADQPALGVRQYNLSDEKLNECVDNFNSMKLDHVFHLGDFIDGKLESFGVVLPIINRLEAPFTLVLGNHDFSVSDEFKEQVPEIMGLEQRYFAMRLKGWKFIILDGNDVSLFAWPDGSQKYKEALEIHQKSYKNHETFNGALGDTQMSWLKKELERAEMESESVILLCHFPILPVDNHVLWNSNDVLDLISGYSCVKAWFNGHNHSGAYAEHQGIYFVTFQGMVDTEETSYATVLLEEGRLLIKGIGRVKDRELILKR